MDLGQITYHQFVHATKDGVDVCAQLVEDLGDTSKVCMYVCVCYYLPVCLPAYRMFAYHGDLHWRVVGKEQAGSVGRPTDALCHCLFAVLRTS